MFGDVRGRVTEAGIATANTIANSAIGVIAIGAITHRLGTGEITTLFFIGTEGPVALVLVVVGITNQHRYSATAVTVIRTTDYQADRGIGLTSKREVTAADTGLQSIGIGVVSNVIATSTAIDCHASTLSSSETRIGLAKSDRHGVIIITTVVDRDIQRRALAVVLTNRDGGIAKVIRRNVQCTAVNVSGNSTRIAIIGNVVTAITVDSDIGIIANV